MRNNKRKIIPIVKFPVESGGPPPGVISTSMWVENRIDDICEAMARYAKSGYTIPIGWVIELDSLSRMIKTHKAGKPTSIEPT